MSNAANLAYDTKYPKILPSKGQDIYSLIRYEHEKNGHAGVNYVFSQLQRRFWIIRGRESVRHVINRCVVCQKSFKKPSTQLMADLPAERVDGCAPFEATGLDVFGPYVVKNGGGRGKNKRWVLLLTCMSCRAVHFELLKDMSSSTFLNALIRFHARRPGLRVIFSDDLVYE